MPEIRFNRTNRAKPGLVRIALECLAQASDFHRIAQCRTVGSHFHIAYCFGVNPSPLQRRADQIGLCVWIRDGIPASPPTMINESALNDAKHDISVGKCLCQWFQEHGTNALGGNQAVAIAQAAAFAGAA